MATVFLHPEGNEFVIGGHSLDVQSVKSVVKTLSAWLADQEAVEQRSQSDECPKSSDHAHSWYQGSVWQECAHCGIRR